MLKQINSDISFGGMASNGIHVCGTIESGNSVTVSEKFGQRTKKGKIDYIWEGYVAIDTWGVNTVVNTRGMSIRRVSPRTMSSYPYRDDEPTSADYNLIEAAVKEVVMDAYKFFPAKFKAAERINKMNELVRAATELDEEEQSMLDTIRNAKEDFEEKQEELTAKINELAKEIQDTREEVLTGVIKEIQAGRTATKTTEAN